MKKVKNILILAGGDCTRFWPLKNKILFSFLGRPLIEHIANNVMEYGEKIFVVIEHSLITNLKQILTSAFIIPQDKALNGQAGAILSAKEKIKGNVLILNANDIIEFKIVPRLIDQAVQNDLDMVFLAKKLDHYFPGGYLKFDRSKNLKGIVEKPLPERTPSNLVNLNAHYFKDFNSLITTLERINTTSDDWYEQGLSQIIAQGKSDYFKYKDYWFTLKYPWHVLQFTTHFLNRLVNNISLAKNVKIAKSAKIVGPCFIDDNTVIGDYTLIRQSHIGKNCQIGGYSEITRSYLGDNVSLHRNYIGDSVLADNVSFGAQAATANFRFDEKSVKSLIGKNKIDTRLAKFGTIIGKDSKIGVNATLLPGVKIGINTFIGPGETVYEEIEDNMFVIKGKKTKNIL